MSKLDVKKTSALIELFLNGNRSFVRGEVTKQKKREIVLFIKSSFYLLDSDDFISLLDCLLFDL